MPRYFFETNDGDVICRDDEGQDLPDAEAARKAALEALPDMARDRIPDGDHRVFVTTVRDERGATVYVATLLLKGEWQVAR